MLSAASVLSLGYAWTTAADAVEPRCKDYEKINRIVRFVKQRVQSKLVYLKSSVEIIDDNFSTSDVRLWLQQHDKSPLHIPVHADGRIELPVVSPDDAEDSKICVNLPKGSSRFAVTIDIRPPPEKRIRYRELFVLLDDFNAFTSEMGGVLSWFVADKDVLELTFDSAATVEILSQRRPAKFKTSADYKIAIERQDEWQVENPFLILSARPLSMKALD